jgi:hypothetical protein
MTLFVVLGLVAVVVGVLVAVALGVRSMRAEEQEDDDDWESAGAGGERAGSGDPGRRRIDRRRPGTRRASGHPQQAQPQQAQPQRAEYGGSRGYERRAEPGIAPPAGGPGYDPSYDAGYAAAPSGGGHRARGTDHGFDPGGYDRRPVAPAGPLGYEQEPAADAMTGAGRAAGPPSMRAEPPGPPRGAAQPARRGGQQRMPSGKRSRRGRDGDGDGWTDTDWDRVSDEDYWAELSADKPLASRTAQSAADLRSAEPARKRQQDKRTDPNLARAHAPADGPDSDRARPIGVERAEPVAAPMTARRVGHGTDPGLPVQVPGQSNGIGYGTADYADPNLAVLASLSEPVVEHRSAEHRSAEHRDAAISMASAPVAAWAATTGPNHSPWPQQHSQDQPAMAASPGGRHGMPPPDSYGSPSYPADQQAGSPPQEIPGYGAPAGTSHPAGRAPGVAAAGSPTISYGIYGAGPDQATGQFPGRADAGTGYNGHYGAGAVPAADNTYGTSAYQSLGAASAPSSYGAGAPDAAWVSPGAPPGPAAADAPWRNSQPGVTGPVGSTPAGGYHIPARPNGYGGAISAPPPPGQPRPAAGTAANGYPNPPQAGGFASGYLSSSALSARQGGPEPEPLAMPGAGNPYGSYVTGPSHPVADAGSGAVAAHRVPPPPRDPADYDESAFRGYGDYSGGGSHH